MMERRKTRKIMIGSVAVGGDAPISVESMTKSDSRRVEETGSDQHTVDC
jgi:(E)-4-hydroxy-3-methylbut-2-enyl-diphosphate synthase